MKEKWIILVMFLVWGFPSMACEVCQVNQPKMLKNITHGTGPQGNTDMIIIWSAAVIVTVTLFFSIKYLVNPKENNAEHIKNSVINHLQNEK